MATEAASVEGIVPCQTNTQHSTRHDVYAARIPQLSPQPCSDAKPSRTAQLAPPHAHSTFLGAFLSVGVLQSPIRTLFYPALDQRSLYNRICTTLSRRIRTINQSWQQAAWVSWRRPFLNDLTEVHATDFNAIRQRADSTSPACHSKTMSRV